MTLQGLAALAARIPGSEAVDDAALRGVDARHITAIAESRPFLLAQVGAALPQGQLTCVLTASAREAEDLATAIEAILDEAADAQRNASRLSVYPVATTTNNRLTLSNWMFDAVQDLSPRLSQSRFVPTVNFSPIRQFKRPSHFCLDSDGFSCTRSKEW